MNIKFIKAERFNIAVVHATYSLNDEEFTVVWEHDRGDYDLMSMTEAKNQDLRLRVNDCIREGESDTNPDEELYLFIRDTFDRQDCKDFGWNDYQLADDEIDISFSEEIEGTYVIKVELISDVFHSSVFEVNCQFEDDSSYNPTNNLSCSNDSGGDVYDSGLRDHLLEEYGIEDDSKCFADIQKKIEKCANDNNPFNTVLDVLKNELDDDSIFHVKGLFGAFGPADVKHEKYINSENEIIVTSEDTSTTNPRNSLLGYKVFDDEDDYSDWCDKIMADGHYGDCSVSYRAWQNITKPN